MRRPDCYHSMLDTTYEDHPGLLALLTLCTKSCMKDTTQVQLRFAASIATDLIFITTLDDESSL